MSNSKNTNQSLILKKAIASSMVSKCISLIYQLVSLPILLSFLGTENFGLYSTLVAVFGWVFLISGGINPGVTRVIARSGITNVSIRLVVAAKNINLSLILIVMFSLIAIAIFSNTSTVYIFSFTHVFVMLMFCLPIIYFSLTDSVRQGLGEQHYNNMWYSIATLISVIIISLFSFLKVDSNLSITLVIVAIYGPNLLSKLANTYFLKKSYKSISSKIFNSRNKTNTKLYKILASITLANILIQLSVVINKSVVMILSANYSLADTAKLELIFRFFMLAATFFSTIQLPLWPLITKAIKDRNNEWIIKVRYRIFVSFILYSIVLAMPILFLGEYAFSVWSNGLFTFNQIELKLIAVFFFTAAVNQASIIMLLGYGKFGLIGKALITESVVLVAILLSGFIKYDIVGILSSMIIARLCTSTVILPLKVWRVQNL